MRKNFCWAFHVSKHNMLIMISYINFLWHSGEEYLAPSVSLIFGILIGVVVIALLVSVVVYKKFQNKTGKNCTIHYFYKLLVLRGFFLTIRILIRVFTRFWVSSEMLRQDILTKIVLFTSTLCLKRIWFQKCESFYFILKY